MVLNLNVFFYFNILSIIIVIVCFHSPQTMIKEVNDQVGKWLVQGKLRKDTR